MITSLVLTVPPEEAPGWRLWAPFKIEEFFYSSLSLKFFPTFIVCSKACSIKLIALVFCAAARWADALVYRHQPNIFQLARLEHFVALHFTGKVRLSWQRLTTINEQAYERFAEVVHEVYWEMHFRGFGRKMQKEKSFFGFFRHFLMLHHFVNLQFWQPPTCN